MVKYCMFSRKGDNMKLPRVGMRIIKTMIAVFFAISISIILKVIDISRGKDISDLGDITVLNNMYTPFFAGIAAAYALHRDTKSSFNQAKIRSFGSIIGGYFGMVVILIAEYILITVTKLNETNYPLYLLITYLIVSVGIIPLIVIAIIFKQQTCVFISCLTYLSVTISIRNGGMNVILFASNRVLSTLIGIGISLLVNNISLFRRKNKDILFVSSLDNNFLTKDNINPYIKYKLNNLYYKDMPLVFATTRTPSSLNYVFDDVEVTYPMVIMNGASIYHFDKCVYEDKSKIDDQAEMFIESLLEKLDMNAFRYVIDDNMLHCLYQKIENEAERNYYNHRRNNKFNNFVRAKLLKELDVSLYIIIDKKDRIDNICNEINNSIYKDFVDLVVYKYESVDGDYWYLKINSKDATKERLVYEIKERDNFSKLVVCGSGKTDLNLIEKADFSMCLDIAPDYIKEKVDLVVKGDNSRVLKIFEKIYHAKNINKTINKIKKAK